MNHKQWRRGNSMPKIRYIGEEEAPKVQRAKRGMKGKPIRPSSWGSSTAKLKSPGTNAPDLSLHQLTSKAQ